MKKTIVLVPVSLFFAMALLLFRAPSLALSSPLGFTNTPVPTDIPAPTETPVPTLQPTAVPTEQPTPQPTNPPSHPQEPAPTQLPALGDGEPAAGQNSAALGQIRIASLGLAADLQAVPWTGKLWNISNLGKAVGWLQTAPVLDPKGTIYLAGHLDLKKNVPGPFSRLETLRPEDAITLKVDGKNYVYEVSQLKVFDAKDTKAMQTPGSAQLILITCAGVWDAQTRQYEQRLVVYANLVRVENLNPGPIASRMSPANRDK